MSEKEKDYKKVYVKLSNDSIDNLDKIAKKLGMSRSSLIAYYVGQGISNENAKERLLSSESVTQIMKSLNINNLLPIDHNK